MAVPTINPLRDADGCEIGLSCTMWPATALGWTWTTSITLVTRMIAVMLVPATLVAVLLATVGCSTGPMRDPATVLLDRDTSIARRTRALRQLAQTNDDAAAQTLLDVLMSDRQPIELRSASFDALATLDADRLWRQVRSRLHEVGQWDALQMLLRQAVTHQRADVVPAIARSWARISQRYRDNARPERQAITALSPDRQITDVLWAIADGTWQADDATPTTLAEQIGAWTVLSRLVDESTLRSQIKHRPGSSMVLQGLERSLWLDELPGDREAVLWMLALQTTEPTLWAKARSNAKLLTDDQSRGLALRHVAMLARAQIHESPPSFAAYSSMISRRVARVAAGQHFDRETASVDAQSQGLPSQRLMDHADDLTFLDYVFLDRLLDAMGNPTLVAALLKQARQDMADTRTEYGGVLAFAGDSLTAPIQARLYLPTTLAHDRKFYSSGELVLNMYSQFAHYHFHCQQEDNVEYAGPGQGDLKFAEAMHANCVVFTYVGRDRLNVDWYRKGRVVVDLGVIGTRTAVR